jgi:Domain of unknown function (DUF4114)/PEP-CTERM motif
MNTKLATNLFIAAAAITGAFAQIAPAAALSSSASVWDRPQPTILGKSTTQFDDTTYQKFVQKERVEIPNSGQFKLDPTKLNLKYDYNVSAFFINEGAGYRNQLAFTSTGETTTDGLLFKDISCTGSGCVGDWGGSALKLGDGVQLGNIKGGSQLDFFLRADGLNRRAGANVFGTKTAQNQDGLQHVVAYAVGKKYLLLGFEDLYGEKGASGKDKNGRRNENSDRDFNDAVFLVDIGEKNMRHLIKPVPEPSIALPLIGLGAAGLLMRRRRQVSIHTENSAE